MKIFHKAITLMELMIVVVLVGILASISLINFRTTVLKARTKEAQSLLLLIKHAEEVVRAENNTYVACANTADCNNVLRLNLPTPTSPTWTFSVPNANANVCCAQAVPSAAGLDTYRIRQDKTTPANDESEAVKASCP